MADGLASVWKFTLPVQAAVTVELPVGAQVLDVQVQGTDIPGAPLTMWAAVDPTGGMERRAFVVAGTGHTLPFDVLDAKVAHVATVQTAARLVWHVFDCGPA